MAYSTALKARVLVEALWCSDVEAARRHGVSAVSVRGWRKALASDAELGESYRETLEASDGRWRVDIEDVASQTARDLASLQARLHSLVVDIMDHPEDHQDENGATPTALDRVRIGSELMTSLRQTLDTTAELLTHFAAIVGDERPDVTAQKDRENHEATTDRGAGESGSGEA